jgi:metal-sulfur cluster biosynthetic enzyme
VWAGFCAVEVAPSPKLQAQEVGVPVDVSVNWTGCPAAGDAGLYANEAVSAATTVTVLLVVLDSEVLWTVSVTA